MSVYNTTRSIAVDFGGAFNPDNFETEIESELGFSITYVGFTTKYQGNDTTKGTVTIIFNGSQNLTAGDELLIDTLVTNHDSTPTNNPVSDTVFGTGVNFTQSSSTIYNSSTDYENGLVWNLNIIETGTYYFQAYYEWSHTSKSSNFNAKIDLDGSTRIHNNITEPSEDDLDQRRPVTVPWVGELTSGNHTFSLEYKRDGSKGTSYIYTRRFIIWRVD